MILNTLVLKRAEFLEWLVKGTTSQSARSIELSDIVIPGGSVGLVWPDIQRANLERPLVCVRTEEHQEFLAFLSTYVPQYAPFTAFFRVIPFELLRFIPFGDGAIPKRIVRALIGAIIADAATQSGDSIRKIDEVSVQACLTTTSYVGARAVSLHYVSGLVELAIRRSSELRANLGQVSPRRAEDQAHLMWSVIASAVDGEADSSLDRNSDALRTFVKEALMSSDTGFSGVWSYLRHLDRSMESLESTMRGSREDRVRLVDKLTSQLNHSSISRNLHAPIMGFAVAMIGEGSLDYLSLADRFSAGDRTTCLWFGLFCGLNPNSNVFSAGGSLGERLMREFPLREGALPTIRCDISFEELTLSQTVNNLAKIRRDVQSILNVEVIPGVSSQHRISGQQNINTSQAKLVQELKEIANQISYITSELDYSSRVQPSLLFWGNRADSPPATSSRTSSKRAPKRRS